MLLYKKQWALRTSLARTGRRSAIHRLPVPLPLLLMFRFFLLGARESPVSSVGQEASGGVGIHVSLSSEQNPLGVCWDDGLDPAVFIDLHHSAPGHLYLSTSIYVAFSVCLFRSRAVSLSLCFCFFSLTDLAPHLPIYLFLCVISFVYGRQRDVARE